MLHRALLAAALAAGMMEGATLFQNLTEVTINATGAATLYPSNVTVSGMTGVVSSLDLQLNLLAHTSMSDVDMLLVSPWGASFLFLSDVGGSNSIQFVDLTISDSGPVILPNTAFATGTYRPTDVDDGSGCGESLPGAPATGVSAAPCGSGTLNGSFGGGNPNGTWSLYVYDDGGTGSGTIQGWGILLTTGPGTEGPGGGTPGGGSAVPEPSTIVLTGMGLAALGYRVWRRG